MQRPLCRLGFSGWVLGILSSDGVASEGLVGLEYIGSFERLYRGLKSSRFKERALFSTEGLVLLA